MIPVHIAKLTVTIVIFILFSTFCSRYYWWVIEENNMLHDIRKIFEIFEKQMTESFTEQRELLIFFIEDVFM